MNQSPEAFTTKEKQLHSTKGVQLLGGMLHMVTLESILQNKQLDKKMLKTTNTVLMRGYPTGVHQANHTSEEIRNLHNKGEIYNPIKSGCGFADGGRMVIEAIQGNEAEIKNRVLAIYSASESLKKSLRQEIGIEQKDFKDVADKVYKCFQFYDLNNLALKGPESIQVAAESGSVVTNLEGEHNEQQRFITVVPNITFDSDTAAESGHPAYNLDLWAVMKLGRELGMDTKFVSVGTLFMNEAPT